MRIHLSGDSGSIPTINILKNYLTSEGFSLSSADDAHLIISFAHHGHDFVLIHMRQETTIARNILQELSRIGIARVLLDWRDKTKGDEVRIYFNPADAQKLEVGLLNAISMNFNPITPKKQWWKNLLSLPVLLLGLILPSPTHAQVAPQCMWDSTVSRCINAGDQANRAIRVNIVAGSAAGPSFADSAAFTFGTTSISNIGFVVDDVATNTVPENSAGAPRMNTNRIPYFNPRNNAGTEIGTSANPFRIDPTGTTIQPVSGTVTAKIQDAAGNNLVSTTTTPALSDRGLETRNIVMWPNGPADWLAIEDTNSLRCKSFNSVGCEDSGVGTCEDYQGMFKGVYRRALADGTPGPEIIFSKIITLNNDRGGITSGGASYPFGAAAGRQHTIVNDADSPGVACAISAISTAEVVTSCVHGFAIGSKITLNISGTNSTPIIDGLRQVLILSTTTYQILDTDVTVAGTTGSHYGSRTLTSASAPFVVPTATDLGSLGMNVTLSVGGVVCTSADKPCQGPKFPMGTIYQGTIIAVASTSSVTVIPTIHVDPAGAGQLKIEPILNADSDGLEVGKGWLIKADLNYWSSEWRSPSVKQGIKIGQTYFECEINRNPENAGATFDMPGGYTLFSDYQETSYHLSWNGAGSTPIKRHKVGDTHGWTRRIVLGVNGGTAPFTLPAAGADLTVTVPPKAHWKIISIRGALSAVSTSANRLSALIIDDGVTANASWVSVSLQSQTVGQTVVYSWAPGIVPRIQTPPGSSLYQFLDLPTGLELTAGMRIRTATAGIQAADVWSAVVLEVEEWIEE